MRRLPFAALLLLVASQPALAAKTTVHRYESAYGCSVMEVTIYDDGDSRAETMTCEEYEERQAGARRYEQEVQRSKEEEQRQEKERIERVAINEKLDQLGMLKAVGKLQKAHTDPWHPDVLNKSLQVLTQDQTVRELDSFLKEYGDYRASAFVEYISLNQTALRVLVNRLLEHGYGSARFTQWTYRPFQFCDMQKTSLHMVRLVFNDKPVDFSIVWNPGIVWGPGNQMQTKTSHEDCLHFYD